MTRSSFDVSTSLPVDLFIILDVILINFQSFTTTTLLRFISFVDHRDLRHQDDNSHRSSSNVISTNRSIVFLNFPLSRVLLGHTIHPLIFVIINASGNISKLFRSSIEVLLPSSRIYLPTTLSTVSTIQSTHSFTL